MGKGRKRKAQEALIAAPSPKKQHKEVKPTSSSLASTPKPVIRQFIEEPRGPELKREVELYEQLSSPDEIERLEAADAVVSGLFGGEGVSEAVLTRHLERRLFRGLASGRKAARLGFSVVVTEILARVFGKQEPLVKTRYTGLRFDNVLEMLRVKTKPEGDLSGQEERDHAFGLLFGLQCFVRAEVLFVEEEEKGADRWERVFDKLLQLAKKKPWMREKCGFVIVEALEQMSQQSAEDTLRKLQDARLAASPEGVGIWLTARRKFSKIKFPLNPWGQNGNPLEHLSALAKALKESSSAADKEAGEGTQQTGNWHHQLHFAWDIVLHEFVTPIAAGLHELPSAWFSEFWKVAVDENLFSSSASPERKFWGFLVFQRVLRDAAQYPWILNDIFSQNFMRCLINHISHKDRFLHRAAEKCIKSLLQQAEAVPEIVTAVIPQLISNHGVYNFDQITKTKTVEKLLSLLDGDDRHKTMIERIFLPIKTIKTADLTRDAELKRQTFGDYILSMIRRTKILGDMKANTWIESHALPFLASLAYSEEEDFTPPISEKTRTIFRSRLNSAFTYLISDSSAFSYPCGLLQKIGSNAVDMDENVTAKKDEALMLVKKLTKKAKKAGGGAEKPLQALAMLFALVIFQLYNGEPDAISLLDELKLCHEKLIGLEKDESDAEASVVLVEILLSFMSKRSALLRKVAQQTFTAFSSEITEESLKLLIDVLDSSESLKGQQDLFDQENDDLESIDNDDNDDDDDDEPDSDVEILDVNGVHEHDNLDDGEDQEDDGDEESGDDAEDESVEDDEEDDDPEVRKLEEALAKALGTHRTDGDSKDDSSDSDEIMSDSEMMALDSKLIEIFSQRKKQPSKKQEKKDARENIINFKSRVLDLLEIFVEEQAASPLAFDLLVPILKFMRTTTAKQLNEKGHKVIASFAKASKAIKTEDSQSLDRSRRVKVLKDIHEEASKERSHSFTKAASTASLLVATTLYRASTANMKKVDGVYHDTQARWHAKEAIMQVGFFQDWLNWCQSHLA